MTDVRIYYFASGTGYQLIVVTVVRAVQSANGRRCRQLYAARSLARIFTLFPPFLPLYKPNLRPLVVV